MNKVTLYLISTYKWMAIMLLVHTLGSHHTLHASEILLNSLRLGFTADLFYGVDINDARAAQELWLRTVLQKMNKNKEPVDVHIVLFSDIPALIEGVKQKKVDAVTIFPLEYLSLNKQLQMVPFIISQSGDSDGEHYILLTHKNSNIENIEQLYAKKLFVGARGDKRVPLLWLDTMLLKNDLP
ncbi:MAG: PhnD/SsuA/transferrin family substrate-binding protein, partial [Candidatus Latescibacterota bacterium]